MTFFLARIISWIASIPVLILPGSFLLVNRVVQNGIRALKWTIFSYVFVGAVVLFILAGVLLGLFSDIDVSRKEQRPLLFLFSAIIIIFYGLSLYVLHGPKILAVAALGFLFATIVIGIASRWIKASIHVATVSALVILVGIIYGRFYFLASLIFIPLIIWSRIKLKKHTAAETIAGGLLGSMLTIIFYVFAKFLL